jgi:hypothetical protein
LESFVVNGGAPRLTAVTLVCLAIALGTACGGGGQGGDDDGPIADGGLAQDAGPSPLDAIAGSWQLDLIRHGGPSLACEVVVTATGLEATCPGTSVPRGVGEGCVQLREDEHVVADLQGIQVTGRREQLVQFDGPGCAVMGHTTGAAYPAPPTFLFGAQQQQFVTLTTLLDALGGRWHFHLDDPSSGEALFGCTVDLAMAPHGVSIAADCPVSETTSEDGCVETVTNHLDSSLQLAELTGSLVQVLGKSGTCSGDNEVFRYDFSASASASPP